MGVISSVTDLVKRAPVVGLGGIIPRNITSICIGLRSFGTNKDIGSHVTLGVVRITRRRKLLGPNCAVIRPADKGAKINLTVLTTTGNCGTVFIVPSAVDVREHLLLTTCNTRLILAPKTRKVGNSVTETERVTVRPRRFVPVRFSGSTGPTIRRTVANPRVVRTFRNGAPSTFVTKIKAKKAIAKINGTLHGIGPGIRVCTLRPASSTILDKGPGNPRGVRNVKTKFVPSMLSAALCGNVIRISGRRTFRVTQHITQRRNILIKVSNKTTVTNTVRITVHLNGNGSIIAITPSGKRHCLSAPLFDMRW